jgi:hypothetical protein
MRRILFTFLAVLGLMTANAQNLNKIKDALAAKKLTEAKGMVETFLASPKNQKNPELLYLKGKVLSAIAADATERKAMPEARLQALDAFKKSLEADKNQATLFLTVDNYQPVFSLYASGFEEGAGYYNEEKYNDALATFKTTGVIGDYIFSQGWGLYQLDTTLIYYMGLASINGKKEDEAITYFAKLADANVGGSADMATPYRYLAKHYYDKKDDANITKYINAGLKLFPKDDYLPLLALDYARDKGDAAGILKKFEELLAINPESFDLTFEYAGELFSETHVAESSKRPADYTEKCKKIEGLYNRALTLKPESYETMLSLGKHFYNQLLFIEEDMYKVRGTKPEDVKKKADLQAIMDEMITKTIPPLEKVFSHFDTMGKLKVGERSNFKSACTLLNYCYDKRKDKAKADFYQKKYDEADTAHQ